MKPEVTDQDAKVAVALGGGKSHEAPIHPAMRQGQPSHTVSAQPALGGTNVGVGVAQ